MSITELPGGHCFICHKDFPEKISKHDCSMKGVSPTACASGKCSEKYPSSYELGRKWLSGKE